jgi:hypothetical protein
MKISPGLPSSKRPMVRYPSVPLIQNLWVIDFLVGGRDARLIGAVAIVIVEGLSWLVSGAQVAGGDAICGVPSSDIGASLEHNSEGLFTSGLPPPSLGLEGTKIVQRLHP